MTMGESEQLLRRLARERAARKQAEGLLEEKSLELFYANQELRKLAEDLVSREARTRSILEAVADGIITMDADHRVLSLNRAARDMFRYDGEAIIGRDFDLLVADPPRPGGGGLWDRLGQAQIGDPAPSQWQVTGLRGDGTRFPMELSVNTLRLGPEFHYIARASDITQRREAEERIHRLAYYDGLTALPNRLLFKDRASQAIAQARRHGDLLALLFLDLDQFKRINDTLGHSAGDRLLQEVAGRLLVSVRESDLVITMGEHDGQPPLARIGGDEFTILLTNLRNPGDATPAARRMLGSLSRPFSLEGEEIVITISIGIAVFPHDGEDLETLLKNADTAMYVAKERGRNGFEYYAPAMNEAAHARLNLEHELRRALVEGELEVYYQPQVDARNDTVTGLEALVRWRHPQRGLVAPGAFLPLAEETGLLAPISEWVLHAACRQNRAWQDQGLPPVPVFVNVASPQFRGGQLAHTVNRALARSALPPRYLHLELTETTVMQHQGEAVKTLRALREMGIRIAIDDFGTGYSSLGYLKGFPIDILKIDRSFIKDTPADPDDCAIVTAVLGLAEALGLGVIAEGVETPAQRDFLVGSGCSTIQGYLYYRPLPAEAIPAALGAGEPASAVSLPAEGRTAV